MSFHQRRIQPWSIQTESHLTLYPSECWDVIKGGAIKEGDVEGAHQQISRRAARRGFSCLPQRPTASPSHCKSRCVHVHLLTSYVCASFSCFVGSNSWCFYCRQQSLSSCHLQHKVSKYRYRRIHAIFKLDPAYIKDYEEEMKDYQVSTIHQAAKESEIRQLRRGNAPLPSTIMSSLKNG